MLETPFEVVNFVTDFKTAIPLAGPANKQGRIAAIYIRVVVVIQGTQGYRHLKASG